MNPAKAPPAPDRKTEGSAATPGATFSACALPRIETGTSGPAMSAGRKTRLSHSHCPAFFTRQTASAGGAVPPMT